LLYFFKHINCIYLQARYATTPFLVEIIFLLKVAGFVTKDS